MGATSPISRWTVDLSAYPDLVVIYLGMGLTSLRGLGTVMRLGREIAASVAEAPDGLLLHEPMLFSLAPLHAGMRQYWRDLDALERWTREGLHRGWWTAFLKDPSGTFFWHETYRRTGGFEAVYDAMDKPFGMMKFAGVVPAKGPRFSARARLDPAAAAPPAPVQEAELE